MYGMHKFVMLRLMGADPYRSIYNGDGKGGDSDAPDYTPMAQASERSAQIMSEQADRVLAEQQRQYDKNTAIAEPIVKAQSDLMNQQIEQGNDYYDYMKGTYRPTETALANEALGLSRAELQQVADLKAQEDATGAAQGGKADNSGSQALMQKLAAGAVDRRSQEAGDSAAATARQGTTQQMNQLVRQGMRYGYSPARLGTLTSGMASQNALGIASQVNQARTNKANEMYAKKMDVAGLGRGLVGASQGAYSLANQSGNSAVGNQMQPSNQMMNGQVAAAGIMGQGQQMRINGLGSILNAQTSVYNNANSGDGGFGSIASGLGSLGMAAGSMGLKFAGSDRRLKQDIQLVGVDEATGLNLYEFSYIADPGHRFRGVMADEVEKVVPDAVMYSVDGFAAVDYGKLGIQMVEV